MIFRKNVKHSIAVSVLVFLPWISYAQNGHRLLFPDWMGWNVLNEGQELTFRLGTTDSVATQFSLEGAEGLGISFDSLGNFYWKPGFDLVDRVSKSKDFTLIFEAAWPEKKKRIREAVTFTVHHVNRPPVIEDLPVFYVKQATNNTYQIPSEYAYDPDGDPMVFKAIPTQMPEGANLSSLGQFTWKPSRSQFSSLKKEPIIVEFIVQDQPDKAESIGKLKIAPTQQDLPPEILIVPGDTAYAIKEDDLLNLKIYLSDPNGDENVSIAGFVADDSRIPNDALKGNTPLQYEFIWTPGYDFVDDVQGSITVNLTFYVLDKSNNKTQRTIHIKVDDAENLIKKDGLLFQKYRNHLVEAYKLIQQLDANQKKLNIEYKKAKRGKKHRSILNASLGAVTGISPVVIEPDQSKIVTGVGGTTVLTLGTLEATEVIGRSKESVMEKIKINIDLRNRIQSAGDEFARKYALKLARRNPEFDKDIEKLRVVLNDQRIVLLELDAYSRNVARIDDQDLKKTFLDYGEGSR